MSNLKEEIIKDFRNKFGGDVWLGADRAVVESFLSSKLDEIEKEVMGLLPENVILDDDFKNYDRSDIVNSAIQTIRERIINYFKQYDPLPYRKSME